MNPPPCQDREKIQPHLLSIISSFFFILLETESPEAKRKSPEKYPRGFGFASVLSVCFNVKTLQKDLDNMSRELRLLDNAIQSLNWSTEL